MKFIDLLYCLERAGTPEVSSAWEGLHRRPGRQGAPPRPPPPESVSLPAPVAVGIMGRRQQVEGVRVLSLWP